MLSDNEYDDPDKPMMEGRDDEFSDLELEDDGMEMDTDNPSTPAAAHIHTSPSLVPRPFEGGRGRRKGLVHTGCACVINHPDSW